MLKKGLPWLLLVPCLNVYAGTAGPVMNACQTKGVTTPCALNTWSVAASALYLQPSSIPFNPIVNRDHFLKSPYDWGFNLEGTYYFNTGNDLNIDWLNFSGNNKDQYTRDDVAATKLFGTTKVNIINLELGQKTLLSENTSLRLFAGAQYAFFKHTDTRINTYVQGTDSQNNTASYHGAGARLGAHVSQQLPHGFNAFAQGAMSTLIGNGMGKTQLSALQQSVAHNHMHMVPALDAKLGLSYQVTMQKGSLDLTGGWMFQRYFDAILTPLSTNYTYDYSLNGPYIKAKWTAAV